MRQNQKTKIPVWSVFLANNNKKQPMSTKQGPAIETVNLTNQSERVDQAPHLVVGQQGQQQGNRQRSGWC